MEKERRRPESGLWSRLKPKVHELRHAPTPAEELLWRRIRDRQISGAKFRRQHAIGVYVVDFYCAEAKLVVEIDGPIHEHQQQADANRQAFLESQGLHVLRFTNEQVMTAWPTALETIRATLGKL
jgi:very-short-patch-repair endonuclease